MQRVAARLMRWPTPKPVWRSGGEAMAKACGVVMAMLPG